MIERRNAEIYAFDPTPKAFRYAMNSELVNSSAFHFFDYGLSDRNKKAEFFLPQNDEYVSGSEIRHEELKKNGIVVSMKNLYTIAKELGHVHIDIMKMDIEGTEFVVVDKMCDCNELVIDQICFENHHRLFADGKKKIEKLNKKLYEIGYELVSAKNNLEILTYVRKELLE